MGLFFVQSTKTSDAVRISPDRGRTSLTVRRIITVQKHYQESPIVTGKVPLSCLVLGRVQCRLMPVLAYTLSNAHVGHLLGKCWESALGIAICDV